MGLATSVDTIARVLASEREHALQQSVRADVALYDGRLGPGQRVLSDVLGTREQIRLVGLLARWLVRRPVIRTGRPAPRLLLLGVDPNHLALVVDADQALVPSNP